MTALSRALLQLMNSPTHTRGTAASNQDQQHIYNHVKEKMQDPDILERNPGLANLIADLNTRFITPTGTSLEYDQELQQARYHLKNKKEYLETKTVFEPIDRLRFLPLDSHHGPEASHRIADLQRQVSTHIDRILSLLEARRLVIDNVVPQSHSNATQNDSKPTISVLELLAGQTKDKDNNKVKDLDGFTLDHLQPHLDALETFSEPMTLAIQQSIHQRAQDIVTLHNNVYNNSDESSSSEKGVTAALASIILHTKRQQTFLDRTKEESALHDLVIQRKVKKLFDTLHRSIVVLWEIIIEFKIRYQLEQDQTFQEYFCSVIESITVKLGILKMTIQESVYDNEAVQRLVALRDILHEKQQALELQTRQNAESLRQYRSIGHEFNVIVDAYTDILQRIEIVQDDIRRLE
ncbi:HAUS augmin-like complex subunit 4 [Haplosporangium sp. Z 767]|nr:HAUS augmin-like complex subunit 4 [Haplosporangium sp. Z 11]KAF9192059.1 HAUS augmin-like complex subunit 4 [Haplosporangium sp. Z 767]